MSKKDEKPTLDLESLAAHIEREEADYGEDGHVCIALPLAKDVLAALEHRKHLLNVSENVDWAREISRRLYELVGDQLGELKHGPDCPMCVIEPALDVLVERIPELEARNRRLQETLALHENPGKVVVAPEYLAELEREVKELALARNASKYWRQRAGRAEAAARRAYEFLVQEGYECGATSELRAALAAAPAENPVCECGHQRGVHIGLLGAKRLQCGLCRCDEFALPIPEPAERWREPQIGDHVKVSGTIQSIEGGIAQVALYRSYPVGAVQAMQCGALEYVPARDGGEDAPAEEGGGG